MIRKDCFGFGYDCCHVLKDLHCTKCSFYKKKKDITEYKNKSMEDYKIIQEKVKHKKQLILEKRKAKQEYHVINDLDTLEDNYYLSNMETLSYKDYLKQGKKNNTL